MSRCLAKESSLAKESIFRRQTEVRPVMLTRLVLAYVASYVPVGSTRLGSHAYLQMGGV